MAMSLLTDAEKAALTADFTVVTNTWLRPLTVYQEAQRTVVVSNPNWNPLDGFNQNSLDITNTPVFTTISGAILWAKNQDLPYITPGGLHPSQLKVKDPTSRACRLKVDASGYALLQNAKQVTIDGEQMVPDSAPRPHGLFGVERNTFYYVRAS